MGGLHCVKWSLLLEGDHLHGLRRRTGQLCGNTASPCHAAEVLLRVGKHMCSCYFLASQLLPSIGDIIFTAEGRAKGHLGGAGAQHPPTKFDSWQL